mmetsp:Transcript_116605/g.370882  ORF Transcript_116605/g.370882 Transcript_116605/m.370882 type:complete len:227 (+) Transcript_116605:1323-2003(+)
MRPLNANQVGEIQCMRLAFLLWNLHRVSLVGTLQVAGHLQRPFAGRQLNYHSVQLQAPCNRILLLELHEPLVCHSGANHSDAFEATHTMISEKSHQGDLVRERTALDHYLDQGHIRAVELRRPTRHVTLHCLGGQSAGETQALTTLLGTRCAPRQLHVLEHAQVGGEFLALARLGCFGGRVLVLVRARLVCFADGVWVLVAVVHAEEPSRSMRLEGRLFAGNMRLT